MQAKYVNVSAETNHTSQHRWVTSLHTRRHTYTLTWKRSLILFSFTGGDLRRSKQSEMAYDRRGTYVIDKNARLWGLKAVRHRELFRPLISGGASNHTDDSGVDSLLDGIQRAFLVQAYRSRSPGWALMYDRGYANRTSRQAVGVLYSCDGWRPCGSHSYGRRINLHIMHLTSLL